MKVTVKYLIRCKKFFAEFPDGKVSTGVWTNPYINKQQFTDWFMGCLHEKINRNEQPPTRKQSPEYQRDQQIDARLINSFYSSRTRNSGRNLLRTKEMQKRYPHVNNYNPEA